jgi:adenylate cyclase
VRISGQLIEAATGAHLWSDKIDGALEDVFELQDEVTLRVAGAIEPSITQAEMNRAQVKPTSNLDAYDLYLRALSIHYSQTRGNLDEALRLLDQAIALDPGYSLAKAFAASIHVVKFSQGWASPQDRTRAVQLAREALSSSRDEPKTITFAALCLAWLAHEHGIAVAAVDRAVYLNPNSFDVLMRSGAVRNEAGDFDRAIDHFLRSIRSSPLDPQLGWAHGGLAYAYIAKGDYEKALEYARRSAHEMPQWTGGWLNMAVACAYLGDLEAAREAVRRLLQLSPNFSISTYRTSRPGRGQWISDRSEHGLRLAGLPEG